MSGIELVIADVDGTLVTDDKRLTPRACEAARRLREEGIALALTSGRPPRGLSMVVGPLGIDTPVAAFNGGIFVEPDLITILDERTLPLAVSTEVSEALIAAGLDVWVYRGAEWYVRSKAAPHVAQEMTTVRFEPTVVADLREVLPEAVKIVGVSDDGPLVARLEAELGERMGGYASASRSQSYYLDVTHAEANKGAVVHALSRRLHVPREKIATIGDMPTDVLMFAASGTSIAMGNASLAVRRCAQRLTTSNEEDGFAHAMERFVLGKPATAQAELGLPPRTRALLFDLDGVLTKTAELHAKAWKATFDEFLRAHAHTSGEPFVPFDPATDYTRYVDGKLREDGARSFLESRGVHLPDDEVRAIAARKDARMTELLGREHVETYGGSVRYLRRARRRGLRTAVVSASKHCREVLASAGIADLFDARIDGLTAAAEKLAGKPAPDTFLAAARAVGVEPAEAAVFEDAIAGVEAGRTGHFGFVVGVDRADQREALRHHGADVVVEDLAALLSERSAAATPPSRGAP
jgi:beta-phosphoglucomutase family hydrolase/Cof subfamily protein (haloacid dehalogenase superfamily)